MRLYSEVLMPLRAFLLLGRNLGWRDQDIEHWVLMPLRAFLLLGQPRERPTASSPATRLNALAGIFAFGPEKREALAKLGRE